MSSSPVSAQCLCLIWWSYCNLQDHSELISPCAPVLIWGVTNWMLINHKAGRKRWPSVRLWACILSRLCRAARPNKCCCLCGAWECARCKLRSVICVEPDRKSESGKQITGWDYMQSYLMTCGPAINLKVFGHYSHLESTITNEQIISKRIFFQ